MLRALYFIALLYHGSMTVECLEKNGVKLQKQLDKFIQKYKDAMLVQECANKTMQNWPNCSVAVQFWSKTAILAQVGRPNMYGHTGIQTWIENFKTTYPDAYMIIDWERVTGTKNTAVGFGLCNAISMIEPLGPFRKSTPRDDKIISQTADKRGSGIYQNATKKKLEAFTLSTTNLFQL
ncbi:unnamed protein product [Owenia fusiformis]|uniref:Uncharacterized protein n=1 Tax=Owenia fusiformis TaxID=6347 RepID=A0A8S4NXU8_OWEFU|nr:unnamed protein product [Owenia fusiformis]